MLSIIYITMNRSEELKKSILSCETRVSVPHEYVIIDNGSTDNTEPMISGLKKSGLLINYFKQKKNMGVSEGRNIGYRLAKGDICYFIDDDAVVSTEGLIIDKAYNYLDGHADLYAMSTNCYDHKKNSYVVGGFSKKEKTFNATYVKGYTGFSHFISKTRYPKSYLYPNNLIYGSEELYFALSAFKHGGKIWYYKEMLVEHFPSLNTRNTPYWQKKNAYINTYVIKKYFYPQGVIWISSIFFAVRAFRNDSFKISGIKNYFIESRNRYDGQFRDPLSISQYCKLIKTYRMMSIL